MYNFFPLNLLGLFFKSYFINNILFIFSVHKHSNRISSRVKSIFQLQSPDYTYTLTSSVLMQFSFMLHLIEHCIKFINNRMSNLLKLHNFSCDIRSASCFNLKTELRKCMDLYSYSCDLIKELSDFSSLTLLLCITITFAPTVMTSYLLMQRLMVGNIFGECTFVQIFIFTFPLFWKSSSTW